MANGQWDIWAINWIELSWFELYSLTWTSPPLLFYRSGVCIWDLYSKTEKVPPHFIFDNRVSKNLPNVPSGSSSGSSSASGTTSSTTGLAKGAWMSYFQYPKHTAILSLSWDPTPGSHLLASTSALDSTVVIWDTLTDSATPLRRPDNGLHIVRWSPNGVWLFVASV